SVPCDSMQKFFAEMIASATKSSDEPTVRDSPKEDTAEEVAKPQEPEPKTEEVPKALGLIPKAKVPEPVPKGKALTSSEHSSSSSTASSVKLVVDTSDGIIASEGKNKSGKREAKPRAKPQPKRASRRAAEPTEEKPKVSLKVAVVQLEKMNTDSSGQ